MNYIYENKGSFFTYTNDLPRREKDDTHTYIYIYNICGLIHKNKTESGLMIGGRYFMFSKYMPIDMLTLRLMTN